MINTETRITFEDLLEKHFPKGKCKERGHALVLIVEIINYLENSQKLSNKYS